MNIGIINCNLLVIYIIPSYIYLFNNIMNIKQNSYELIK